MRSAGMVEAHERSGGSSGSAVQADCGQARPGGSGNTAAGHARGMARVEVDIPIHTQSEANLREHWGDKAKRVKLHRNTAYMVIRQALKGAKPLPCTVTLTRMSPRLLDDDNLRQALKATRDGIADWLGVDDRSPLIRWEYDQKQASKYHAVRVEVNS